MQRRRVVDAGPDAAYWCASQNEQARNGCSPPGQPVDVGLGAVAQQQAVVQQVVLERGDGAEHPRVVGRDEPDLRQLQQRGVDLGRAVVLHERVALGVEALSLDLAAQRVAQLDPAFDRARRARARVTARMPQSNAAQSIARECVKCCRSPRISQMPLSCRSRFCST